MGGPSIVGAGGSLDEKHFRGTALDPFLGEELPQLLREVVRVIVGAEQ
jgi:hypothetical protein